MLFELAMGNRGFVIAQYRKRIHDVPKGWRPHPRAGWADSNPRLWSLITDCWCHSPELRPNFKEIVGRLEDGIGLPSPAAAVPKDDLNEDEL